MPILDVNFDSRERGRSWWPAFMGWVTVEEADRASLINEEEEEEMQVAERRETFFMIIIKYRVSAVGAFL